MNVIVAGGGKIGFYLVKTLLEHGHTPHLIEENRALCTRLANQLDIPIICADATTIDGLRKAGIKEADAVVGVTGQDEDNLIVCQLAKKKFNTRRTVAKVNNPKNVNIMKQLGVDIVISSTDNISRLLEREVDLSPIKNLMSLHRGEVSLIEVTLPDNYIHAGKSLAELGLSEDLIIVTLTRGDELIIPRGNTTLEYGDKLTLLAKDIIIHQIGEILEMDEI